MSTHLQFSNIEVDPATSLRNIMEGNSATQLGPNCWDAGIVTAAAGHGTAVASLIAGKTYGSAKGATIVDARAFNCEVQTTMSRLQIVFDWIPGDRPETNSRKIVNASFAASRYGEFSSLNTVVDNLHNTYGITTVAAAGNENDHTFWYAPAGAATAITAGGLNKNLLDYQRTPPADTRWAHSNYGGVKVYAAAQYVESAHIDHPSSLRSEANHCIGTTYPKDTCTSGTSFAAPLTAGVVARYLQNNPGANSGQIVNFLTQESALHTGMTVENVPVLSMSDCQ